MEDKNLYDIWKTMLEDLLEIWRSNQEGTKKGVLIIHDRSPSDSGIYDISQFAFKEEVKELNSYKNFVSYLEEVAPKSVAQKSWNILNNFFEKYARNEDNLWELNKQRFEKLYKEYEKAIYSESYSYNIYLFLAGATLMDENEYQLNQNIRIHNLNFEDKLRVREAASPVNSPQDIQSEIEIGPKLVVTLNYDLDWDTYGSLSVVGFDSPYDPRLSSPFPAPYSIKDKVYEDKTKILLSLRLLNTGEVFESLVIWENELPWMDGLGISRLDKMYGGENRLDLNP